MTVVAMARVKKDAQISSDIPVKTNNIFWWMEIDAEEQTMQLSSTRAAGHRRTRLQKYNRGIEKTIEDI